MYFFYKWFLLLLLHHPVTVSVTTKVPLKVPPLKVHAQEVHQRFVNPMFFVHTILIVVFRAARLYLIQHNRPVVTVVSSVEQKLSSNIQVLL